VWFRTVTNTIVAFLFSFLLPATDFTFLDQLDRQLLRSSRFCNREGNFSWCRRSFRRLLWSVEGTALAAALKMHPLFWNKKRLHWVFGSRRLDTTILPETSGIKYPVTQRDIPEQQIPLLDCLILKAKAQRSFDRSTWRNIPELNLQQHRCENLNPLKPNDYYSGRTAPLNSKCCILYIYSTNIGTEYFKHGIYSPFFPLQNAICFINLTYLVPVLFTFYIQGVLKLKT